ncbi:MAG: hypothetical protein EZS28_033972, partial [Streblomastix strix]
LASQQMSVNIFRPNEIAEIRLKFSNVNKSNLSNFDRVMSLSRHYHSMRSSPPSASFRLFDPLVLQGILFLFPFHLGLGYIFYVGQR